MTKYVPVENEQNMYRDLSSGAIVYINNNESTRELKRRRRERAKALDDEVNELRNELSEIKTLLKQLIER